MLFFCICAREESQLLGFRKDLKGRSDVSLASETTSGGLRETFATAKVYL
jgi:hypothetical protein